MVGGVDFGVGGVGVVGGVFGLFDELADGFVGVGGHDEELG